MILRNNIIYQPQKPLWQQFYFYFACLGLLLPFFLSVWALFSQFSFHQKIPSFIWRIAGPSVAASLLATVLSVFLGYVFAHALYRVHFWGQGFLRNILGLTMVLPSIVAIIGLIHIFGYQGIINRLLVYSGFEKIDFIYNMLGVIIAFTFFNIPFCTLVFWERLGNIPASYWHSAELLGFSYIHKIRHIEWPLLKKSFLHTGFFVFLLCFTSFAPVLIMGGGKVTTYMVALYNALKTFNMPLVIQIASIQFMWSLAAMVFLFIIGNPKLRMEKGFTSLPKQYASRSLWHYSIVIILSAYIFMPIIAVIIKGFYAQFWLWFIRVDFLYAFFTSLYLAFGSALLAVFLSLGMASYANRKITIFAYYLPLMLPAFIFIAGIFILLSDKVNLFQYRHWLIVITAAFMAMPLSMRILADPIQNIYQTQYILAYSLGFRGISWYRIILLPQIRPVLLQSFIIVMAFSFGDFGIIAFLGTQDLKTLPLLLYEQMGRYRFGDADALASILLLFYVALFGFFNRNKG